MSTIPGLTMCPIEDTVQPHVIESITGNFSIPASRMIGNCRNRKDFQKVGVISRGSSEQIFKCRDISTDEFRVLKPIILKEAGEEGMPAAALREINILNWVKNDNVVKFYGVASNPTSFKDYLILDYTLFSLRDLIDKKLDDLYKYSLVKNIMKQLFEGLFHIHDMDIIHRAINCQTITFTETGVLKIGGFENACFNHHCTGLSPSNEMRYRAPEILLEVTKCTSAIDMWAVGCVFSELVLRKPIFEGNSEPEVLRSIFDILGTPSEPIWPGFNDITKDWKDKNKFIIGYTREHTVLNETFAEKCSLDIFEIIQYLFVYFPSIRHSCTECLKSSFFKGITKEVATKMKEDIQVLIQKAVLTAYDVPLN